MEIKDDTAGLSLPIKDRLFLNTVTFQHIIYSHFLDLFYQEHITGTKAKSVLMIF